MPTNIGSPEETLAERDKLLLEIEKRVLWLSIYMVDYANNVRPNRSGLKVGGHQASSSSVVSIMTFLFFDYMNAGDRISIKPHASPVFHAIQYLLGNLEPKYLNMLRDFHGLQAYPSRTKDPDGVDFTTGSVGLGAVAPNFAWLTEEYIRDHTNPSSGLERRFISLVGDAELDEGVVWEAIADPALTDPENIIWVVDLNRQSLDRIIPGIRVKVWQEMFEANGWNVVSAKYGTKLQAAFEQPEGHLLKSSIDGMSNELYQRLLRVDGKLLREWLPRTSKHPNDLDKFLNQWDDDDLLELMRNLGGHDLQSLRTAFNQIGDSKSPNVIFAYTLKGWMLPSIGDAQNHSVSLNPSQIAEIRETLGITEKEMTSMINPDSPEGRLCLDTGKRLKALNSVSKSPPDIDIPDSFGRKYSGHTSTQQIFGLVLTELSRSQKDIHERLVTVSPDVASSTNLGGWINRVGVWNRSEHESVPNVDGPRALQWIESRQGQHIELGISENNLFTCLGQLGLSYEMNGELLFPIGTLYDPFIRRGLDAFMFNIYSGARFIVVGTPSGLTLGPEGGSHQSQITPSIGIELADLSFYEPCFGQELEWIILSALEKIRTRKESTYLRLTTMPVNQEQFDLPTDPQAVEKRRQQVISGAYRLINHEHNPGYNPGYNVTHIFASGAVVPEAIKASQLMLDEGIYANVVNVTGPGPLYRAFQESTSSSNSSTQTNQFLSEIIHPDERIAPIVTVVDGHPHSLAWLGAALETKTIPLGATAYGQSGDPVDLYREYKIDARSIMSASYDALGM